MKRQSAVRFGNLHLGCEPGKNRSRIRTQRSQGQRKREWSGLLFYQEVGAGPSNEVTSEQTEGSPGWPGRGGIQAEGEPAWAHSDTVLPSSRTTQLNPHCPGLCPGRARYKMQTRSSPPCPRRRTGLPPGSSDLWAGSPHLRSQSPQTLGPQLGYKFSRCK